MGELNQGTAKSKLKEIAYRFRFNIYLFVATTVLLILALLGVV